MQTRLSTNVLKTYECLERKHVWRTFLKFKLEDLKNYLQERGIQLSDGGKAKRKAALFDLCEKQRQWSKLHWRQEGKQAFGEKLQTSGGRNSFLNIPEFPFGAFTTTWSVKKIICLNIFVRSKVCSVSGWFVMVMFWILSLVSCKRRNGNLCTDLLDTI